MGINPKILDFLYPFAVNEMRENVFVSGTGYTNASWLSALYLGIGYDLFLKCQS